LEREEDRVLAMESVYKGVRSWGLISLEVDVSSPNPDPTEGHKHNSATVPYLGYFYPKYSRDPRFNWDEQILVTQDKALLRDPHGINEKYEQSMQETG
jgi:hypothetical protein